MNENPTWHDLEDQLDRLFKTHGVIGYEVFELIDKEVAIGVAIVERFKGWQILSDSFKSFYLETFKSLEVSKDRPYQYADFVSRHSRFFRLLRSGEILFLNGYALQGYSLLRTIVEQAQLRSAILLGVSSFEEVEGISGGEEPFSPIALRRRRIRAERRVFSAMSGVTSGLSESTISALRNWDDLFDLELHGMRLSLLSTFDWLKGEGGLDFFPSYDEKQLSMFMNRFAEVGWMLHRLLPSLQLSPFNFSSQWIEKWSALDQSFHAFSLGLSELGKPVGTAIIEFVTTKFPFNAQSTFPITRSDSSLPDGESGA